MTPRLTKGNGKGNSFHGAFQYYLHDKRSADQAAAGEALLTAERVAWTEVLNMPTDDVDIAKAIMIDTAQAQDRIKRRYQESLPVEQRKPLTGRKDGKPVLTYSLSWSPEEKDGLTRDEMLKAAQRSMEAIGGKGYQAIIVAHNDTAHPHVHVIVNRVNETTGILLSDSQIKLKLSAWAEGYERERGKVYCEQRVENNAARAREMEKPREEREFVRYDGYEPQTARDARMKAANENRDPDAYERTRREYEQAAARLAQRGRDMHDYHSRLWASISGDYQGEKDIANAWADQQKQKWEDETKARYKPQWAALFKAQERRRAEFEANERSVLGTIGNIVRTVTSIRVSEHSEDHQSWIAAAFSATLSEQARRNALGRLDQRERRALSRRQGQEVRDGKARIEGNRREKLDEARSRYQVNRANVIAQQERDKAALKQDWQDHNAQRRNALTALPRDPSRQRLWNRATGKKPTGRERVEEVRAEEQAKQKTKIKATFQQQARTRSRSRRRRRD